jgi:hypothetical protein
MVTVTVVTGTPEVQVSFNGSTFYFPTATSKADYSDKGDTIILQCPPIGLSIPLPSASYQFVIDSVAWVGTFSSLAETFNKTIFFASGVSPAPGNAVTIRASAVMTGAYVATNSFEATNREQVNLDFTISGTPANSGSVVALIETSDDNVNWVSINNLTADNSLKSDGAATPYSAGNHFRDYVADFCPILIPYEHASLPPLPIRIAYKTGYGRYYRLKIRACSGKSINTGAPATFANLEIKATLQ